VNDRLFHLVTGEAARNENTMEKIVDVQFPFPRKLGKEMNIEPVATVDDGNGRTASDAVCGHFQREQKYRLVAVQQVCFSGWRNEVLHECLV
jgi:hypothetical protein